VWSDNDYTIELSSFRKIKLRYKGKVVGFISTCGEHPEGMGFLNIGQTYLDTEHRGKGLGKQMYIQLLKGIPKWNGISSYLPNRINQTEIPKIYKSLNETILGNWAFIIKE